MAPLKSHSKVRPRTYSRQQSAVEDGSAPYSGGYNGSAPHSGGLFLRQSSLPALDASISSNASDPPRSPTKKQQLLPPKSSNHSSTGASIPSSIFNLSKCIIGSGILALPAGVASFGDAPAAVLPGLFLLALIGSMSAYGFSLIGRVCAYSNSYSYKEAWAVTCGAKTSWIPNLAITLLTLSLLIGYSMILSKTIPDLICYVNPHWMVPKMPALVVTTLVVLLPLCLLKDLKSLAPFSLVGICGMLYTTAVIAFRYFQGSYKEEYAEAHHLSSSFLDELSDAQLPAFGTHGISAVFSEDALLLVSMLSTAFSAHYNAPKFYWELDKTNTRKFHQVVVTSFSASMLLMGIVMAFGFWTFGVASSGLILNNYAQSDVLVTLSRFAVTLSLVCSYPLCFAPLRDGVLDWIAPQKDDRTPKLINRITILLLWTVTSLALVTDDLRLIFALKGATFGTATMYLFPSYMMAKYCYQQRALLEKKEKVDAEHQALVEALERELPLVYGNFILGLIVGCIGTFRALQHGHHDPIHGH